MAQNWMAPWLALWPEAGPGRFTGTEGAQRFLPPAPEVNGKGDPELETRIVRDVATYGAQLGQIAEIVLALAKGRPAPEEALAKLRAIVADIEALKASHTENTLARARTALEDLRMRDRAGYDLLLASIDRDRSG